jgi:tRNA A-37 threonylcarbamoyl transferase component Bud32
LPIPIEPSRQEDTRTQQIGSDHFQGLDFDQLWDLPLERLDCPNQSGSGYSEVLLWKTNAGTFAVKRQSGYCCRTWRHPFRGIPTAEREFHNLQAMRRIGLPVPRPVYFSRRKVNGHLQSILITEYAEQFISLGTLLSQWNQKTPPRAVRKEIISAVARLIRNLHQSRHTHRHLVPKHILLKPQESPIPVMLIDLETLEQFRPFRKNRQSDLASLNNRCNAVSRTDKLRFLFSYLDISKWTPQAKAFVRDILQKTERKKRKSFQKRRRKMSASSSKISSNQETIGFLQGRTIKYIKK